MLLAVASKTTVYTIPPPGHIFGGSGRIRTYGPRKETLVFKTSAFNRSATDPIISSNCVELVSHFHRHKQKPFPQYLQLSFVMLSRAPAPLK